MRRTRRPDCDAIGAAARLQHVAVAKGGARMLDVVRLRPVRLLRLDEQ